MDNRPRLLNHLHHLLNRQPLLDRLLQPHFITHERRPVRRTLLLLDHYAETHQPFRAPHRSESGGDLLFQSDEF